SLSQRYDLIIASGSAKNVIEVVMERFKHHFKHVFSSVSDRREVGKTPQFYEMICRVLSIEPKAMVHVGDEWYSDFISARRVGIKSFYLDRTGGKSGRLVIKDLRELEDRLQASSI
ncbi:MAG: HAD family hydrolase, partial [Candidatus Bathyarchaeia archaeon]